MVKVSSFIVFKSQVDVSKTQGKPASRKPVIHYAFEVFSNFLCIAAHRCLELAISDPDPD